VGVAKPDFLRCVGADQILIENAERFARIDLDLSDFEKERTHYGNDSIHKMKRNQYVTDGQNARAAVLVSKAAALKI